MGALGPDGLEFRDSMGLSDDEVADAFDGMTECRLCGLVDHEVCQRAATGMTESDEGVVLDLLNGTPKRGFWPERAPKDDIGRDERYSTHEVGGWKVTVYWKAGWGHWQYIESVEAPDGARYVHYSDPRERALPHVVGCWSNTNRLSYDRDGNLVIDRPSIVADAVATIAGIVREVGSALRGRD